MSALDFFLVREKFENSVKSTFDTMSVSDQKNGISENQFDGENPLEFLF
jgi:hypothetical protein